MLSLVRQSCVVAVSTSKYRLASISRCTSRRLGGRAFCVCTGKHSRPECGCPHCTCQSLTTGTLNSLLCRSLKMARSRMKKADVDALLGKVNCKRLLRPEPLGKETLKFQCQGCGEKLSRHTTAQNHCEPCSKRLSAAAGAQGATGGHNVAGPSSRPCTPLTSATIGADVIRKPDGAGPSSTQPTPPALVGQPNHPANSDNLFAVQTPPYIPARYVHVPCLLLFGLTATTVGLGLVRCRSRRGGAAALICICCNSTNSHYFTAAPTPRHQRGRVPRPESRSGLILLRRFLHSLLIRIRIQVGRVRGVSTSTSVCYTVSPLACRFQMCHVPSSCRTMTSTAPSPPQGLGRAQAPVGMSNE